MVSNAKPRAPQEAGAAVASTARPKCDEIFRRFSIQRPEPKGELEHVNPSRCWWPWCCRRRRRTPASTRRRGRCSRSPTRREKMLALGEAKVGDYIKTIGLWRNKAKNVIALSRR
jgi:endonuclease-3